MTVAKTKYLPREQRGGNSHYIPRKLREEVLKRDGELCQVCGKRGSHISHRIPVARGGLSLAWNLVLYCTKCWQHKKDLLPEEFLNSYYVRELLTPDLLGDNPVNVIIAFTDGSYLKGKMRSHPYERQGGDWLIVVEGVEMLIPREQVKGIAVLPRNKRIKVDIAGYLKRISS